MPRFFGSRGPVKSVLLVFALLTSAAQAAEWVNVATPVQGLVELPVIVAMRNRYFATEGLEIRKIQIDPEIAVRSLVAGDIDFNLAWDASVGAAISGARIKLVAAIAARPLSVLMARREIRSGKYLRGKTVGLDDPFSTTAYLARVAVRFLGFEPDKEVGLIAVGGSAHRVEELRAGSIDAAMVDAAIAARLEEEGFKRLVNLRDIIDLPIFGIAVTAKKLATEREQVKKFIRATLRGARFIKQNRTGAVRIIQSYLKISPSQAARAYEAFAGVVADDGWISDRALALSVRRARDGLSIAGEPKLSKVADWSILREILADRRNIPFWLKQYDS